MVLETNLELRQCYQTVSGVVCQKEESSNRLFHILQKWNTVLEQSSLARL